MKYYEKLEIIKSEILKYTTEIFKVYGNELILKLEDYNLLSDENNCIKSSTSPGFIIEEFIVSKLITYTQNHNENENKVKIKRHINNTVNSSYDCYSNFMNIKVLINIKVEKSKNNAIAAINKLYDDYVRSEPDIEKGFLVLKINYSLKKSKKDLQNKIFIENVYSFFIEEIDFSSGHKQDHRNWSQNLNLNAGRLQVSKNYFDNNKNKKEKISYYNTKKQLENIYMNNKKIENSKKNL